MQYITVLGTHSYLYFITLERFFCIYVDFNGVHYQVY